MAEYNFTNNASSTLQGAVGATDTQLALPVGQGELFPTTNFTLTILGATALEIVYVTSRDGDVLTVNRAQENTTAQAHQAGTIVCHRLTAAALNSFSQGGSTAIDAPLSAGTATAFTVESLSSSAGVKFFRLHTDSQNVATISFGGAAPGSILVPNEYGNYRFIEDGDIKDNQLVVGYYDGNLFYTLTPIVRLATPADAGLVVLATDENDGDSVVTADVMSTYVEGRIEDITRFEFPAYVNDFGDGRLGDLNLVSGSNFTVFKNFKQRYGNIVVGASANMDGAGRGFIHLASTGTVLISGNIILPDAADDHSQKQIYAGPSYNPPPQAYSEVGDDLVLKLIQFGFSGLPDRRPISGTMMEAAMLAGLPLTAIHGSHGAGYAQLIEIGNEDYQSPNHTFNDVGGTTPDGYLLGGGTLLISAKDSVTISSTARITMNSKSTDDVATKFNRPYQYVTGSGGGVVIIACPGGQFNLDPNAKFAAGRDVTDFRTAAEWLQISQDLVAQNYTQDVLDTTVVNKGNPATPSWGAGHPGQLFHFDTTAQKVNRIF